MQKRSENSWKKWWEARLGKRKVYRSTKDRLFRFLFEKDRGALLQCVCLTLTMVIIVNWWKSV